MAREESIKETVQRFYREHPLYTPFDMSFLANMGDLQPEVLLLDCVVCRTERPFRVFIPWNKPMTRAGFPVGYEGSRTRIEKHEEDPEPDHYEFQYVCTHCNDLHYYALRIINNRDRLFKIGQFPPPSEKIDPLVENELGSDDASLLKKGLRNLNYGYGIGACAYMRRLIENQITSILNLLKEETQDEEQLKVIEDALTSRDFTTKTKVAKDFAPDSLKIGDMNVLKVIHDEYSKGMHGYTDEECQEIAQRLRAALEFVLVELKAREKKRRAFVEAMKETQKVRKK